MKKERQEIEIIYKLYYDFPFKVGKIQEGEKTIEGRRLTSINCFKKTDMNLVLGRQHNDLIRQREAIDAQIRELTNAMTDAM